MEGKPGERNLGAIPKRRIRGEKLEGEELEKSDKVKLRQTKFNVKKLEVGSLRLPEVMLVGGSEVELGKSTIPSSNKSDIDIIPKIY